MAAKIIVVMDYCRWRELEFLDELRSLEKMLQQPLQMRLLNRFNIFRDGLHHFIDVAARGR